MSFALVRLSVHYLDSPPIRFPPRNARGEMLVSISDSFVVLLFEFVFFGIAIRIAPAPKFFNKPFALIIAGEFFERLFLFIGDYVSDILLQPIFVGFLEFRLNIAGLIHGILALPGVLRKAKEAGAGQDKWKNRQAKSGFLVRHN